MIIPIHVIPVFLAMIPILHYITLLLSDKRISKINYVYPILFLIPLLYKLIYKGLAITTYTLSTYPVFGDLHLPIILVLDTNSLIYDLIMLLIYILSIHNGLILKESRVLLAYAALVISFHSLDLFLNLFMFLAIMLYLLIRNGFNKIYRAILFLYASLNIFGYVFSNSLNIGLFVFLKNFEYVDPAQLGLGLYMYVISYTLVLMVSINTYPLMDGGLDANDRSLLLLFSTNGLNRLIPVIAGLSFTDFFQIYCGVFLLLSILSILRYSFEALSGSGKDLIYFYLNHIYLAYVSQDPGLYFIVFFMILFYMLNILLEERFAKYVSILALFPYPGFFVVMMTYSLVFARIGLLPLIPLLLSYIIFLIGSLSKSFSQNTGFMEMISMLMLDLIIIYLFLNTYLVGDELFNLTLYRDLVLGGLNV